MLWMLLAYCSFNKIFWRSSLRIWSFLWYLLSPNWSIILAVKTMVKSHFCFESGEVSIYSESSRAHWSTNDWPIRVEKVRKEALSNGLQICKTNQKLFHWNRTVSHKLTYVIYFSQIFTIFWIFLPAMKRVMIVKKNNFLRESPTMHVKFLTFKLKAKYHLSGRNGTSQSKAEIQRFFHVLFCWFFHTVYYKK